MTRSTESAVRLEIEAGVGRLTLTRGDKHNALDPPMLAEIVAALRELRGRDDVRVVVIASEGKAFCAGVDLRGPYFMENVPNESVFEGKQLLDEQHEMISAVYELPALTIASVQGNAVGGGGFGLAMACDLRFAVRSARFWMVPSKLAVVQDFGLTWLLQRVIGPARTMELLFSGEQIDAARAERLGFVNRVYDDRAALDAAVDEFARSVGSGGADAVRMGKYVVRHGADATLADQLRLEAISNGLCFQSTEFRTAKDAFLKALWAGDA